MKFRRARILSYEKIPQSFMQMINSIDHTYGNPQEPYEVRLEIFWCWGLFRYEITQRINLPKGFNHELELRTGREWKL